MNVRTTTVEPAGAIPEITSLVHDLRNPLSTIYAGVEPLISSTLCEPQVHQIARNLHGASVHIEGTARRSTRS